MRCPYCSSLDTQVKDSRPTEDSAAIRRRRVCPDCGGRFTTFERVQLRELTIVKRSGRRVPFDRDKLGRSIEIALRKRPVEPERVERLVNGIVRQLESGGESEGASETVGELVMEGLRALDDVAYVRYASVYKGFREARDFEELLERLAARETALGRGSSAPSANGRVTPDDDVRLMRLAIALGRRHLGLTWPNPSVGAVLVREVDGEPRIVAQGVTQPEGGRMPSRSPWRRPVRAARGGTLYVSLEPCSHHGRTPPCTDAIVRAGVARVVTGVADPDPRVAGRGHALLRDAGIAVTPELLALDAASAHRGHITRVREGRPAVTAKLARTADGFAAALSGDRLLITGDAANARTHMLRAQADAVAVGIGRCWRTIPGSTSGFRAWREGGQSGWCSTRACACPRRPASPARPRRSPSG
jgi:transcriptional repressor NrdR